MSTFAAAIQLEAILGNFAAGLVLDETDKRKVAKAGHSRTDLLIPIFFVTVGAKPTWSAETAFQSGGFDHGNFPNYGLPSWVRFSQLRRLVNPKLTA